MSKTPEDYWSGHLTVQDRNILKKRRKATEIKGLEILVWLKVRVFNCIKNNYIEDNC